MKGLSAPLSAREEVTLRRIGFGTEQPLDRMHVQKLLNLELIEWQGVAWGLTAVGRQRYNMLITTSSPPTLSRAS